MNGLREVIQVRESFFLKVALLGAENSVFPALKQVMNWSVFSYSFSGLVMAS